MSLQSHLGIDVDHVQTLKAGSLDQNDELGAEAEDWETQEYHELTPILGLLDSGINISQGVIEVTLTCQQPEGWTGR
jgi:hypothetical protein